MNVPKFAVKTGEFMSAGNSSDAIRPKAAPPTKRVAHVLPTVMRMRSHIDLVFSRYVGPISSELGAEEFDRWRDEGEVGPKGLHRYITRLARYIPQDDQRREFMGFASRCIQLLSVARN